MSKDDLEIQCMNELFKSSRMTAQIYVKSTEGLTSMLVAGNNGNVYFKDVLDVPEITGIQRCVSFVKHDLSVDGVEIYPDKLSADEFMNDPYIKYCNVNHSLGRDPNPEMVKRCNSELSIYIRWPTRGGRE